LNDKVAISFLILIVLTLIAIIVVACMEKRGEKKSATFLNL
jgi:heme/copper-type cytochrome/quinol oxidase subunit 4